MCLCAYVTQLRLSVQRLNHGIGVQLDVSGYLASSVAYVRPSASYSYSNAAIIASVACLCATPPATTIISLHQPFYTKLSRLQEPYWSSVEINKFRYCGISVSILFLNISQMFNCIKIIYCHKLVCLQLTKF